MASIRSSISSLIIPGARHSGGLLVAVDPQPWHNITELLLFETFSVNVLDTPKNGGK